MAERVNTPFTSEHFVAYCLRMVGHPYWYGTCGYKATSSLLSSKTNQYPSHYTAARKSRYQKDIANKEVVCDCIGGAKGYAWSGGGESMLSAIGTDNKVSSKYGSNGCPDKGANGMFTYAKSKGCSWGTIDTLPEVPGLALYKDGHAGYYVGNGYAVEWQGFNYGCVKTVVANRPWTHWYALPFIDYGDADLTTVVTVAEITLGSRLLQNGSSGTDVAEMQKLLIQLGYDVGSTGADGKFGKNTETGLKAFQKKAGVKVDGKYGDNTHAALMAAVSDQESGQQPDVQPAEKEPEGATETPPQKYVTVVSSNGSVNIREGNGTTFSRITQVANGTKLKWIATAENGWHAVLTGAKVGWISGDYSKV